MRYKTGNVSSAENTYLKPKRSGFFVVIWCPEKAILVIFKSTKDALVVVSLQKTLPDSVLLYFGDFRYPKIRFLSSIQVPSGHGFGERYAHTDVTKSLIQIDIAYMDKNVTL